MDTKKLLGIGWVCVWAILGGRTCLLAAQPKAQEVEVEGSIVAVMPAGVQIKTLTGQGWMFRVSPKAQVHLTGTAEKSFLKPGVFVEFAATLDQKFHATSKVMALTICSPSPQKFPGLFPEGGGLQLSEQPGPKPKKKEVPGPGNYQVVGAIMGVKDGQYSVRTPQALVVFELDDNAEIKVDFTTPQGLMYARPGDQIMVKGVAFHEGMGEAREVTVKLLTALAGPETGRTKKKPERKTTEKPDEAASAVEKSAHKSGSHKSAKEQTSAKE